MGIANGVVGNVKSLTDDVSSLIKKVNELEGAIEKLSTTASGAFESVKKVVSTGGQLNNGKATRRQTIGTDGANFSNGVPTPISNMMNGALGGFSQFGGGGGYNTAISMGAARGGNASFGYAQGASSMAQGALGIASGAMKMGMDTNGIVNRAMGYYQGTLLTGGQYSRGYMERSFLKSMGGGVTGVGSDAAAFSTLANAGFMPGSQDMRRAGAEIGGAAKYLGVDNSVAASAIARASSGQTAANLYQYGISTWNADGTKKSFSQIANDVSNVIFDKGKNFTKQGVAEAFRSGFTQQNLAAMGMSSPEEQQMMQALFMAQASGKKIDLAKMKAAGNNLNPADPYMRMNTSQTQLQGYTEGAAIQGLSTAAGTVEAFNNAMKDTIKSLEGYKAYLDGVSGTNVGRGAGSMLRGVGKAAGGALMAAGAGLTASAAGAAAGLPMMMIGGVLTALTGGGNPGFGAGFGGKTYTGGGTPGSSAAMSAGFGAVGSQWNSTTGGKHMGTDYVRPKGTAIHAHADGIVSGEVTSADYGNAVLIDHAMGYQTLYAHLNSKSVSAGTKVTAGQVIGTLGDTGKADGAHLHYEVRKGKNHPVDPSTMDAAFAGKMTLADVLGSNSPVGGTRSDYAFDLLQGSTSATATSSGNYSLKATPSGSYSASASSMRSWLMSQGLSSNGAFGVVANLMSESGLRTGAVGDSGTSYGIAQWHASRKDALLSYAEGKGLKANSLEAQQGFLMSELSRYGDLMGTLQDPNVSRYAATSAFMKKFERPTDTSASAVAGRYRRGLGALQAPKGGGTTGYGANVGEVTHSGYNTPAGISHAASAGGGTKNVYINVTIDQASHQQMVSFAEGVQKILEDKNNTVRLGM